EIITAHQFTPDYLRTLAVAGTAAFAGTEGGRSLVRRTKVGKGSVLGAQIQVIRVRKYSPYLRLSLPTPARSDQFVRLIHWQRAKNDTVHRAKNGGIHPDPHRHHQHRSRRKARRFAHHANGIANVFK